MKYAKGALIADLRATREAWMQQVTERDLKLESEYEKHRQRWLQVTKPEVLAALREALAAAEADRPVDLYALYSRHGSKVVPERPAKTSDASCVPAVRRIDEAIAFLELVQDEEVTGHALDQAGVKKIFELTKRPC